MKNATYAMFIVFCFGLITFLLAGCGKTAMLGKDSIKDVVAAMNLVEKAYFVTGTGMSLPGENASKQEERAPNAPSVGQTQKLVPGAAGTTYPIPRLGIPAFVMADGPAGLRISPVRENIRASFYCTAFPVATMLASTWDPEMAYTVGEAMGNEVLEYGVDVLLGPAMNIHRNPLCGRNFEYFSEDPLVTGKMAASVVNGVQSQGVGTSIKHFAANNAETNRNALDTLVGERALREIYLEGYRIAVEEAQPWTIMSSYNLINGVYASESADLLTKILRNDWGFKGLVMTDWFGGKDAVAQMNAGNDLLMPGKVAQANAIIKAVQERRLDEATLNRNIERILNILVKSPRIKGRKHTDQPDLKSHATVARKAAAEGMVLLKNSNATLPLTHGANLAIFGNTSFEIITGGTGSGKVNEAYSISLVEGLKNAGYSINHELYSAYSGYLQAEKQKRPKAQAFIQAAPIQEFSVGKTMVDTAASVSHAALITIGRNSGEAFDRKIEGDFNLTVDEINLIKTVCTAFHSKGKKAIVILNIGGVIETESWRGLPDSILLAWQGGQESGNSIADVISGNVSPSGKLASTFPMRYEDVPSSKNFPGKVIDSGETKANAPAGTDGMTAFLNPKPSRVVYEEGIYIGYRYYESFDVKPAYEFGFGLSYTAFEYGKLTLSSQSFSGEIAANLEVKNTGKMAGREVVQLYLAAPLRKLDKPALELKAFAKTRLLQPGESQTIHFNLKPRQLSSFDSATSSWIAEAGKYEVKVGASSRDIRQTASFTLDNDLIVKKENAALVSRTKINELKREIREK
jgi:beta-glucosidase